MSQVSEWADRYGGPQNWTDPATVCEGPCEGMGRVPVYMAAGDRSRVPESVRSSDETDPVLVARWQAAEVLSPSDDGYHFVTCPACEGTGRRP